MKKLHPAIYVGVVALVLVIAAGASGAFSKLLGPSEIDWKTSFDEGLTQAKQSHKPVMVDFYAEWCGPCKLMAAKTFTDPKIVDEAQHWVAVRIDVDQHQDLAQRYGIRGMPTVAFLRSDGAVLGGTLGGFSAKAFLPELKKGRAKFESGAAGVKPPST